MTVVKEKAANMSPSKALDIDNKELVLSRRQQRIERKLIKCYAAEIALGISRLVEENCIGCILGQLSQTQHDCLMMQRDEQLWRYFDLALSRISEGKIMESFSESLKNIKPEVNGLEMLKYTCRDWRIVFCSDQRRTLKEETFKRL